MSTLDKTDAPSGDPTFAPVRKLPPELLSEIFILCISTLPEPVSERDEPPSEFDGKHMQTARAQLVRVCRWWNTVLNNDARVWATVVLDTGRPIAPEIMALWIKRSKSHPLDVYIILANLCDVEIDHPIGPMLHTHLWRIRLLVWRSAWNEHSQLSRLFPPSVSTIYAPMMQSLCLLGYRGRRTEHLGNIHCPNLRTLTIRSCDNVVQSLIGKPMPSVRHLCLMLSYGPDTLHIKLLNILPNLVSLTCTCMYGYEATEVPNSRVVSQSLKSLTLRGTTSFLACFFAPSLESLHLGVTEPIHALKTICQDWKVTLRHLTIGKVPEETDIHAILPHLTHLITLIVLPCAYDSVDELLLALSPVNRDFTLACPQLKMMEINRGQVSTSALVSFVWRRMTRDLDDPVPGLMTSLKLSRIPVDQDVCEQLVKSHGSSVHIRLDSGHTFTPNASKLYRTSRH